MRVSPPLALVLLVSALAPTTAGTVKLTAAPFTVVGASVSAPGRAAVARWESAGGRPLLFLAKNVPTVEAALAGVRIGGVAGLDTTGLALGFTVVDGLCAPGAPRFEVRLDHAGDIRLGCAQAERSGARRRFAAGHRYGGVLFPEGDRIEALRLVLDQGPAPTLLEDIVVGAAVVGPPSPASSRKTKRRRETEQEIRAFLDRHWRRPLAPQGPAPSGFMALERSLAPESCGTCHPLQLADWKTTRHARAMGPGVTGQLIGSLRSDPETVRLCRSCHAPLAEQQPTLARGGGSVPNPDFDAALEARGLVCAACHVRGNRRFGPPPRDGSAARSAPGARLPHDGFTPTAAFLRSEFCTSCHQFAPDGYALNGKLLENTYTEWRASPAARRGRQCQDCHMPDRRHLWRGIHDPAMVRAGVTITLATQQARYRPGEVARATLRITNTGVGHDFPTYVTPLVVARLELVDAAGRPVAGSVEEARIGRQVALDLSREIADTRIPPAGVRVVEYRRRVDRPGLRLRATVTVLPDHFYVGFFRALLASGAGAGTAEIRRALEDARRSSFEIFRREIPLT